MTPERANAAHCGTNQQKVFLVFGRTGWIGGLVGEMLKKSGAKFEYATARLEDRAGVLADIERVRVVLVVLVYGDTVQLSIRSGR